MRQNEAQFQVSEIILIKFCFGVSIQMMNYIFAVGAR